MKSLVIDVCCFGIRIVSVIRLALPNISPRHFLRNPMDEAAWVEGRRVVETVLTDKAEVVLSHWILVSTRLYAVSLHGPVDIRRERSLSFISVYASADYSNCHQGKQFVTNLSLVCRRKDSNIIEDGFNEQVGNPSASEACLSNG